MPLVTLANLALVKDSPGQPTNDIAFELNAKRGPGNALGGMIIDGVFASESVDSSGESLLVAGCDISTMQAGEGLAVYEHRKKDDPGASPNDILGRIIYARKIFGPQDCEDDRQRWFWDRVGCALIYGKVRLYDGAGHPGAQALAAQVRDHHANGEKLAIRFSIDGSTLHRDGGVLTRTIGRDIALTARPCNRTCDSGVLFDAAGADLPPLERHEGLLGQCTMIMDLPTPAPDVSRLLPQLLRVAAQRLRNSKVSILG